jgi:hypothetical protein
MRLASKRLLAVAAAAVAGLAATPQAAQASNVTVHGCPSGYFCIYPRDAGWNGDRPSVRYAAYGYHNLSNQIGNHRILNNQYGGAWVSLCNLYNGNASTGYGSYGQDSWDDVDLTPINSVVLHLRLSDGCTFV